MLKSLDHHRLQPVTHSTNHVARLPLIEFVPLMALLTAIDALSIDTMLPALPDIGRDFAVAAANDVQLVVSAMFLGMALGGIGGPVSDSFGRRPAMFAGLSIYVVGTLAAIFATSFSALLAARVLQGVGAAIPLVVMTALVRDLYEGAPMASIMSFIGSVFILVPVLAPLMGQAILLVAPWRAIFVMFLVLAIPCSVWFALRQPETLPPERRIRFGFGRIAATVVEVCASRVVIGYAVVEGLLFGAFLGYLSSAQQIFQDVYGLGTRFVLYFSCLSLAVGAALFVNGTLVERFGMQRMVTTGLAGLALMSALFLPVVWSNAGAPPLWLFMAYMLAAFFAVGILFGNLNALAMEPLGHIAGVGAAIVGTLTSLVGLPIGTLVGRLFDGTVLPLVSGFAIVAPIGLAIMAWSEAGRQRAATAPTPAP